MWVWLPWVHSQAPIAQCSNHLDGVGAQQNASRSPKEKHVAEHVCVVGEANCGGVAWRTLVTQPASSSVDSTSWRSSTLLSTLRGAWAKGEGTPVSSPQRVRRTSTR